MNRHLPRQTRLSRLEDKWLYRTGVTPDGTEAYPRVPCSVEEAEDILLPALMAAYEGEVYDGAQMVSVPKLMLWQLIYALESHYPEIFRGRPLGKEQPA